MKCTDVWIRVDLHTWAYLFSHEQNRPPFSPCPRWRQRVTAATGSPRRTAPQSERFPVCSFLQPCATRAWRSLPPKCSKSTAVLLEKKTRENITWLPRNWIWKWWVTLSCTDSETHVPSAVTRPRWASRCACDQAPTKWARLHWESASLLILDSAIQKSNGSPRKREARFCMACSYE